MQEKSYEVIVAGGGVSGVCAAITSARAGKKTALIQNRPVLGGNSSSEIRVWTRGAVGGGNCFAEEMGVLGELKLFNLHRNPEANPVLWDEVLLDRALAEENLDLYLNTHIYKVDSNENGIVSSLYATTLGSEKTYCFFGRMFIDATGDGTIGAQAGVPYRIGREDKTLYNESLAPEKTDKKVLGSSMFFLARKTEKSVRFIKPDYAYNVDTIENILKNGGGRIVNEEMNGCDYWWIEYGGDYDTIGDNQDIFLELKKLSMGIWNYVKNSGKFNADNLMLEWIGNLPGKRESRRFIGEYTLTQKDIEEGHKFEDAVAYGGWYLDVHPSGGIYSNEDFCIQIPVHVYDIPLRCLYNKNYGNLLFAGRSISVSHAALASTRLMDTCSLVGIAAGEAAAYCLDKGISLKELGKESYISEIRQRLNKNDAGTPDTVNEDTNDKARKATVTESGHFIIKNTEVIGYIPVKKGCFLICPGMEDAKEIGIVIHCGADTSLHYCIYSSNLPNRFLTGKKVTEGTVEVKKGQEELKIPLTGSGYGKIVFEENNAIEIAITDNPLTGFLTGYQDSPVYQTPCIRNYGDIYSCNAIINGYNRPSGKANLWISNPLQEKPFLKFSWSNPIDIKQIRITLNPGLDKELCSSMMQIGNSHHAIIRRTEEAKELIKDFDVFALIDGQEKKIAEIKDNYQRLCILNIPEITTKELKLVFYKAHGAIGAEVFEVRIY